MQRVTKIAALAVVASLLAACGGHTGTLPTQSNTLGSLRSTQSVNVNIAQRLGWVPRYTVIQPKNVTDAMIKQAIQAPASSIPTFTASITSPLNNQTYQYTIAGSNPHNAKVTTLLKYVPIVVIMKFSDGTVLDPTQPGCNDTVSVQHRFFNGPNFVGTANVSNGIPVGKTQINDADQRAQWWTLVHGTAWHTKLSSAHSPIIVTENAPAGSTTQGGVCAGTGHRIGEIPINAYDSLVQSLATQYSSVTQIPMVLTYNVFMTSNGCCIIGYHSAFSRNGGVQVYSVGTYNDPGIFSVPIEDIHAWTHEIGELMNDPFINNGVPAWGHVGQVSGCQNNLEVGDPLTGIPFNKVFNGFTYHPQELAFFDWFFRTPSEGTGGKYSYEGTFTTVQGACH